jgi:hypothetical protein
MQYSEIDIYKKVFFCNIDCNLTIKYNILFSIYEKKYFKIEIKRLFILHLIYFLQFRKERFFYFL